MLADLHCHSNVSDGLLPPGAVAARAAANGVTLLALTDHDNTDGVAEALAAAETHDGLTVLAGVEISVAWRSVQVHIVGLNVRCENAALQAGLAGIRSGRIDRGRRMAEALAKAGIEGAFEGAMKHCETPDTLSRAHFARFLVDVGKAPNVRSVFERYLVPGKPGYVEHVWASVEDAVSWIRDAGGVAVIAHPGRYDFRARLFDTLCGHFQDCGGEAIEVVSGSHSVDQTRRMAQVARRFSFLASCGSDFHGPSESYVDLGQLPPLPEDLTPVWHALGFA